MTPEEGGSVPASVTASPDPSVAPLPSLLEKQHIKKNRLSAGALASLLPVSHDEDRRRARKERKRTEKLARREQTLQELGTADRRRAYFRDASHRREHVFRPPEVRYALPTLSPIPLTKRRLIVGDSLPFCFFWQDLFTTDFCYGFIHFAPTLSLNLPGGISFDLMHYWDGQPVRFMCCERKREADNDRGGSEDGGANDVPWGRVLWCVAIESVPDEEGQLASQGQQRSQIIDEDGDHPQLDLADDVDKPPRRA